MKLSDIKKMKKSELIQYIQWINNEYNKEILWGDEEE